MWEKKFLKQWKNRLKKSNIVTKEYCKICFNEINKANVIFLVHRKLYICKQCFLKLNPEIMELEVNNIKGIGIYHYEDVREILYTFKGCYDYELKDVFFSYYSLYLRIKYFNYVIVPIPSYHGHDEIRGFNHVEAMCEILHIKIIKCINKNRDIKQSSLDYKNRQNAIKYFFLNEDVVLLKGKNVLIVDDVLTTSSTMNACIELLKTAECRRLSFLVMSYTDCKKKEFVERNFIPNDI